MATIDDPEESDDGEEARVVKSSTPPAAAGAAALEGEGRGFLITEKPKAVRSTKLVMAPPLPGGEGRLVEELLTFRLLMIALSLADRELPMDRQEVMLSLSLERERES